MSYYENYQIAREGSVRRRVLQSVGVQLYRHPFLTLTVLVALTALAVWRILGLGFQEDLRIYLPPVPAEQRSWRALALTAPAQDPLTLAIRFNGKTPPSPQTREQVAQIFVDALSDLSFVVHATALTDFPPTEKTQTGVAKTNRTSATASLASEPELPDLTPQQALLRLRPSDLTLLKQLATPEGARNLLTALAPPETAPRKTRETNPATVSATGKPEPAPATAQGPREQKSADPLGLIRDLKHRQGPPASRYVSTALANQSHVQPDERTAVVVIYPRHAASRLLYCMAFYNFLNATVETLQKEKLPEKASVTAEFYGRHYETGRLAQEFQNACRRNGLVLLLCLLLLFILAFRKIEALLFVGLPPLIGLVWTYGLASFYTRQLHLLTALLPVLLAALGLEFAFQIYHRFTDDLYRTRRYYPALSLAYTEAGRGMVVSALMSAAVFFSLFTSESHQLRELAVICGLGVLAMAAAALLWLPPMAAIKSALARGRVTPVNTYDFGLNQLSAAVAASPRTTLTLGLIVTAYLSISTGQLKINRQVGLDMNPQSETVSRRGVTAAAGAMSNDQVLSILTEGNTLEEALGYNDMLYNNLLNLPPAFGLERVCSISPILPSPALQTRIQLDVAQLDLKATSHSLLLAATERGWPETTFKPFLETLARWQSAVPAPAKPVLFSDLTDPKTLSTLQQHIVHEGGKYRILTSVVPRADAPDLLTTRFDDLVTLLRKGPVSNALRFSNEAMEKRRVSRDILSTLAQTTLFSALWLVAGVLLHFRTRFVDALLALLPLTCAAIWTFGFLVQFQFRISLYSLLVFPLIIAIALDQTIIFIQRLYERRYASLRQVMRVGGRPSIVSSLSILIGMGCLAQIPLPAYREMATVALIAISSATVCTLTLVPALLQISQEGGVLAWFSAGEDDWDDE
ncbi:MAG TPA: MMPL family transporter [Candidatus Sumerlaeota bacterium]|nr:MMPL family transporter [Candidatus Sumerlaeota bacterium]